MIEVLREFGRRMDSSPNKKMIVDFVYHKSKNVLDLGAGTGKIACDIADAYGCHVDAVDMAFKDDELRDHPLVTYYHQRIQDFLEENCYEKKYDCIIISAVLHELNDNVAKDIASYLPMVMDEECRIIIREPLWDNGLGPVLEKDRDEFIRLVKNALPPEKVQEYMLATKKHLNDTQLFWFAGLDDWRDWVNTAFLFSYGKENWEREKHECRFARSLRRCKEMFDFWDRPVVSMFTKTVLDTTYRQHFIDAGIPGEAFDLLKYTTMYVVFDY